MNKTDAEISAEMVAYTNKMLGGQKLRPDVLADYVHLPVGVIKGIVTALATTDGFGDGERAAFRMVIASIVAGMWMAETMKDRLQ